MGKPYMLTAEEQSVIKKVLITPVGMSFIKNNIIKKMKPNYDLFFTNGILIKKTELIDKLKDKDACILGSETIDNDILKYCPNLKIISRFGSGYDQINLISLKKHRVALAISKGITNTAVSRHTFALILSLTHKIKDHINSSKLNKWDRHLNLSPETTSIGIIGMGAIGQQLAKFLDNFGYKVYFFNRSNKEFEFKKNYYQCDSIEDLIYKSDLISLHANYNRKNHNMISANRIKLMSGKYFVNTSRGDLVDENFLYESLKNNLLIGAAIDVFKNEPASGTSSKIRSLANVISSSHTAAYDLFSIKKVGVSAASNIKAYFENSAIEKDNLIYEPSN